MNLSGKVSSKGRVKLFVSKDSQVNNTSIAQFESKDQFDALQSSTTTGSTTPSYDSYSKFWKLQVWNFVVTNEMIDIYCRSSCAESGRTCCQPLSNCKTLSRCVNMSAVNWNNKHFNHKNWNTMNGKHWMRSIEPSNHKEIASRRRCCTECWYLQTSHCSRVNPIPQWLVPLLSWASNIWLLPK